MLNFILNGNIGCSVISFLRLVDLKKLEESLQKDFIGGSFEYLLGSPGVVVNDKISLFYTEDHREIPNNHVLNEDTRLPYCMTVYTDRPYSRWVRERNINVSALSIGNVPLFYGKERITRFVNLEDVSEISFTEAKDEDGSYTDHMISCCENALQDLCNSCPKLTVLVLQEMIGLRNNSFKERFDKNILDKLEHLTISMQNCHNDTDVGLIHQVSTFCSHLKSFNFSPGFSDQSDVLTEADIIHLFESNDELECLNFNVDSGFRMNMEVFSTYLLDRRSTTLSVLILSVFDCVDGIRFDLVASMIMSCPNLLSLVFISHNAGGVVYHGEHSDFTSIRLRLPPEYHVSNATETRHNAILRLFFDVVIDKLNGEILIELCHNLHDSTISHIANSNKNICLLSLVRCGEMYCPFKVSYLHGVCPRLRAVYVEKCDNSQLKCITHVEKSKVKNPEREFTFLVCQMHRPWENIMVMRWPIELDKYRQLWSNKFRSFYSSSKKIKLSFFTDMY